MKKWKRTLAVLITAAMIFSLAACGNSGSGEGGDGQDGITAGDTIKVGYVGVLSGADAYLGQSAKTALEDYIEELNENGGIQGKKVELIAYDIGMDPNTEIVNAVNRLIQQDKAVAIIGPESSEQAMIAIPIVNEAKVPLIVTTASNVKVTVDDEGNVYPYMFRMCFVDPYQGTALASFAYEDLGLRKTAFLGEVTNIYAQGIQDYYEETFTDLGGEVVSKQGMMQTDVDFRAQLTKIAESGADSVLLATGSYKVVAFVAKQAKQLGLDVQLLGVDGWYAKELMELAGPELEGSFMTNMISDDDPMFQEYIASYTEKHPGKTPNVYAYYALDAMMAIEYAINESGEANSAVIAEYLSNMNDVQLFTSKFTMEQDTHNPHNKPVSIIRITDSEYTTYKMYEPKD